MPLLHLISVYLLSLYFPDTQYRYQYVTVHIKYNEMCSVNTILMTVTGSSFPMVTRMDGTECMAVILTLLIIQCYIMRCRHRSAQPWCYVQESPGWRLNSCLTSPSFWLQLTWKLGICNQYVKIEVIHLPKVLFMLEMWALLVSSKLHYYIIQPYLPKLESVTSSGISYWSDGMVFDLGKGRYVLITTVITHLWVCTSAST